MQHQPSNIQVILVTFIKNSYLQILIYEFYHIFKMEVEQSLILAMLPGLIDADDDKKPTRGKTRSQIKRRSLSGYFSNIIGLRKCFNVEDFDECRELWICFKNIDDIIFPQEINGGDRPTLPDESSAVYNRKVL